MFHCRLCIKKFTENDKCNKCDKCKIGNIENIYYIGSHLLIELYVLITKEQYKNLTLTLLSFS